MIDTEGGEGRGILVVEDDEQLQTALTKVVKSNMAMPSRLPGMAMRAWTGWNGMPHGWC